MRNIIWPEYRCYGVIARYRTGIQNLECNRLRFILIVSLKKSIAFNTIRLTRSFPNLFWRASNYLADFKHSQHDS